MNDYVKTELIELDVLGRKFKFKELTGKEMDLILDKAIKVGEAGTIAYALSAQNEGYLNAVVEVPYEGFDPKSKVEFLNKLKKPIRDSLIRQIREYHEDMGDALKK